jgi:metal-responsive CopG/Arc/MetJ family transcriptional regulator
LSRPKKTKCGRKPLEHGCVPVSVSLDGLLVRKIDKARGQVTRSEAIRGWLNAALASVRP